MAKKPKWQHVVSMTDESLWKVLDTARQTECSSMGCDGAVGRRVWKQMAALGSSPGFCV